MYGFRGGGDKLLPLRSGLEELVEVCDAKGVCEGLIAGDDAGMVCSRDGPGSPGHATAAQVAIMVAAVGSIRGCGHSDGVGVNRLLGSRSGTLGTVSSVWRQHVNRGFASCMVTATTIRLVREGHGKSERRV